MKVKTILAIVGPTAVGKTSVAIAVAQKVKGEIIGLDSRQLYRGMFIGTADETSTPKRAMLFYFLPTLQKRIVRPFVRTNLCVTGTGKFRQVSLLSHF